MNGPATPWRWLAPLTIAIGCAVVALVVAPNDAWRDALVYRRMAIEAGEGWRLVTAHFVHVNAQHALLDVAALLLVAWIFSHELTAWHHALVVIAGVAAVDLGLWFGDARVLWYAGLSGVLHAWFAAGAACWALAVRGRDPPSLRQRRAWGCLLLLGLVVKLAVEARGVGFWLAAPSFDVVTPAHRYGSAAGVLAGAAIAFARRARQR